MEPTITPARSFRLGDIECGVHITDAESKININLASREILERALELLGYDTLESSTVIDSIEDWRDPNQASRLNGAEEDYYMNLPNPYHCKDGPIDHLSELLLVKGVTPEMYWGRGRHSEIQRTRTLFADQAGAVGGAMEGVPAGASLGLVDLFNTYGQGRVNPNTASKEVLSLIPMVDAAAAETIVSVRSGMDRMDGTDDDTPFENLMELPVPPQVANSAFILMSAVFEVETAVHAGGYSRTNVAIVACRDGRSAQVLNAYWR